MRIENCIVHTLSVFYVVSEVELIDVEKAFKHMDIMPHTLIEPLLDSRTNPFDRAHVHTSGIRKNTIDLLMMVNGA